MSVLFKLGRPSLGGLFEHPKVFPCYREISQTADGRIMKKPACGDFFIVKVIRIS